MSSQPATAFLGTTQPPVFMCSACAAVRVDETGETCSSCKIVLANRAQLEIDRAIWRRVGLIAAGIGLGLAAAIGFAMLLGIFGRQ